MLYVVCCMVDIDRMDLSLHYFNRPTPTNWIFNSLNQVLDLFRHYVISWRSGSRSLATNVALCLVKGICEKE